MFQSWNLNCFQDIWSFSVSVHQTLMNVNSVFTLTGGPPLLSNPIFSQQTKKGKQLSINKFVTDYLRCITNYISPSLFQNTNIEILLVVDLGQKLSFSLSYSLSLSHLVNLLIIMQFCSLSLFLSLSLGWQLLTSYTINRLKR